MRVRIHPSILAHHPVGTFDSTPASGFGRPSFGSLVGSLIFHGLAAAGLTMISVHPSANPTPQRRPDLRPTVIKVGDKIYFVAELPPSPPRIQAPTPPKAAPKLAARPITIKSAKVEPAAVDEPAKPAASAPRVFVPPEVHKNLIAESTLIQPLTPPEQVPPNMPLPSFRVFTAQPPKITRQFVTPGRKTPVPAPPDPATPPPLPSKIDLVHADPVVTNTTATLILPPTPPPVLDVPTPKTAAQAPPPAPKGDAVDVLSLSDRPVPPSDKLVVPPGNVLGRTGDGIVLTAGAANSSPAATDKGTGAKPAGSNAPTSAPLPVPASGPGTSTPGPSTGASAPPANAPGTNPAANSAANSARPAPAAALIRRPANGTFDAVVVQTNSIDQFPETKDLLTGRPIYTVYVSVGTAKDWALYFCVPGEKPPSAPASNVMQLGQATPVQAPYPTLLVRPELTIPSFYKYVLVYGRVNAAGRFENLRVVKSIKPETDQALVASLARWEFRPATRDGVNIPVEFLLSIPVAGL